LLATAQRHDPLLGRGDSHYDFEVPHITLLFPFADGNGVDDIEAGEGPYRPFARLPRI
jgi:hypothetical protein